MRMIPAHYICFLPGDSNSYEFRNFCVDEICINRVMVISDATGLLRDFYHWHRVGTFYISNDCLKKIELWNGCSIDFSDVTIQYITHEGFANLGLVVIDETIPRIDRIRENTYTLWFGDKQMLAQALDFKAPTIVNGKKIVARKIRRISDSLAGAYRVTFRFQHLREPQIEISRILNGYISDRIVEELLPELFDEEGELRTKEKSLVMFELIG